METPWKQKQLDCLHLENGVPETDRFDQAAANNNPEATQTNKDAHRRYLRKLDWIILPSITLLYFFEYLDRGNIANAKLYGYSKGHDTPDGGVGPGKKSLTTTQWQLIIMIFYVGLVVCQVPGTIGYRVFPPSKWIAFGVCGWSVASILQTTATNLSSALACRVFIGAFEGLFGTGIVYYLSLWYHRGEMGMRVFWFLGPTAIAGALGGLIAYGVGQIHSNVHNWQILFIIEGLPVFCLGLFCLYWLPDRPTSNSRFKGQDQKIAMARYESECYDQAGAIEKKHIKATMVDWVLYAQASIYLPTAALLSSISGFLPTIVSNLGYTDPVSANLMTVPPYACAFVVMLAISYSSDRFHERGMHIACPMIVGTIAYALLATLSESQLTGKYVCMCIAVACVYATYPPSHAWAANNFGNETKRALGMGVYTAIGNLGSIGGSFIYPSNEAPAFREGHFICMGLTAAAAVLAIANSLTLRAINRHRDSKYGKPVEGEAVDVTELADRSSMFRYIT